MSIDKKKRRNIWVHCQQNLVTDDTHGSLPATRRGLFHWTVALTTPKNSALLDVYPPIFPRRKSQDWLILSWDPEQI
jgi:hypothetical protein